MADGYVRNLSESLMCLIFVYELKEADYAQDQATRP
jgi:hypothetical protein